MPVTVPLFFRRSGAYGHFGRRRALALTAAAAATLGLLAATDTDPRSATPGDTLAAASSDNSFTAFTPDQAQRPQHVPDAVAQEQHALATEAARPHTVRPVAGRLTSNFGTRWGAMHAGLDFGDPLGAPIAAVTDGVVVEAGPASGFGLWVRVQQDDGTVGVYGHVNDILTTVGQPVRAGDVIATVGNRGYSTGPHLHYEVHHPAAGPIDPLVWLAERGIHLGPVSD